jgi:hypothetical protein
VRGGGNEGCGVNFYVDEVVVSREGLTGIGGMKEEEGLRRKPLTREDTDDLRVSQVGVDIQDDRDDGVNADSKGLRRFRRIPRQIHDSQRITERQQHRRRTTEK